MVVFDERDGKNDKGKRNEKGKDLRQQHSVVRKVSSTNTYEEKFLLTCLI